MPAPTPPIPAPLFTDEPGADHQIDQQADQPSREGTRQPGAAASTPVRSRGNAPASANATPPDSEESYLRTLRKEARLHRLRSNELKSQLDEVTRQLEQERTARQQAEQIMQQTQAEATRAQAATEIAHRYDLPPELAKRLQGATPDEVEADAKRLLALISGSAAAAPDSPAKSPISVGLVGDAPHASRANLLVGIARHGRATPNPFRSGEE